MSSLAASQETILQRLKQRGPQSVRILARQLSMSTMGIRQHLSELASRGLVAASAETRQTRGRPLRLWQLTEAGHGRFGDQHGLLSVTLLDALRDSQGESALRELVLASDAPRAEAYRRALASEAPEPEARLRALARLRTVDGYMAEVRLLPTGWLLIEHHCPIAAAACHCPHFCTAELALFQSLLGDSVRVEPGDSLPAGDRRCAWKVTPTP